MRLLVDTPIFTWPQETSPALLWAVAGFVLLFALALGLEWFRRSIERRKQRQQQWVWTQELLADRELTAEERSLFVEVVRAYAPDAPFRAATVRTAFDAISEAAIARARQRGDTAVLEQRATELRDIRRRLGLDYVPVGQPMHSTRELVRGQSAWIAAPSDGARPIWIEMTITGVDEGFVAVAPKPGTSLPDAKPGSDVDVHLWRDEDARYRFRTGVYDVLPDRVALRLLHTSELERIQARAHFRIGYRHTGDVEVQPPFEAGSDPHTQHRFRARFTSLSAGGAAFVLSEAIHEASTVRVHLALGEAPIAVADARVVGISGIGGGQFLVRASFTSLSDDTRERIAHYVFQEQQAMVAHGDTAATAAE